MMDVSREGPALMHGGNQSVLCNARMPMCTLKKKSQDVSCHLVQEGVARDE